MNDGVAVRHDSPPLTAYLSASDANMETGDSVDAAIETRKLEALSLQSINSSFVSSN
jgi:hypothetical protein